MYSLLSRTTAVTATLTAVSLSYLCVVGESKEEYEDYDMPSNLDRTDIDEIIDSTMFSSTMDNEYNNGGDNGNYNKQRKKKSGKKGDRLLGLEKVRMPENMADNIIMPDTTDMIDDNMLESTNESKEEEKERERQKEKEKARTDCIIDKISISLIDFMGFSDKCYENLNIPKFSEYDSNNNNNNGYNNEFEDLLASAISGNYYSVSKTGGIDYDSKIFMKEDEFAEDVENGEFRLFSSIYGKYNDKIIIEFSEIKSKLFEKIGGGLEKLIKILKNNNDLSSFGIDDILNYIRESDLAFIIDSRDSFMNRNVVTAKMVDLSYKRRKDNKGNNIICQNGKCEGCEIKLLIRLKNSNLDNCDWRGKNPFKMISNPHN